MLEGRRATGILKRCLAATPMVDSIVEHFAFGKRVWTRYAPTARARAAICVQRFDDSLNPAIHITYRISLRSSSLPEPRDPPLRGCGFRFRTCIKQAHLVHTNGIGGEVVKPHPKAPEPPAEAGTTGTEG